MGTLWTEIHGFCQPILVTNVIVIALKEITRYFTNIRFPHLRRSRRRELSLPQLTRNKVGKLDGVFPHLSLSSLHLYDLHHIHYFNISHDNVQSF